MPLQLPDHADSLADGVVAAVRDAIASGELDPAATYSVYRLAGQLGVSRSPVREALLRLAEAGLVEISRNRGFRVVRPAAHDVAEIFQIRLALEPPAAARVATDPGRAAAALSDQLATMTHAASYGDGPGFWAADRALHRAVLEAAGNRRAAAVVEQLRATTALLGPPTTSTGRTLADIAAEHAPVVTAILAGDAEAAAATMREHLRRTERLLVAGLSR